MPLIQENGYLGDQNRQFPLDDIPHNPVFAGVVLMSQRIPEGNDLVGMLYLLGFFRKLVP